ncbi:MAG: cytochrome P450, partial [Nitrosospira sp.]
RVVQWGLEHIGILFRILRLCWPIPRFGHTFLVTRYDDVREVFLADRDFPVPYKEKLDVIMGGEPFFLGMGDTVDYQRDTRAMRLAVRREDIQTRLIPSIATMAEALVADAPGRIEIVDALTRHIAFEVMGDYFGVTAAPGADLRVWATRLFEFQFADSGNDPSLRREVDAIAPALRAHIDGLIAARRQSGELKDDVLGRCLALQREGEPGFSDAQIRSALIGFFVGGPPQLPMVVPQALEQLLRRPDVLAGAVQAARDDNDELLACFFFEALRFDPLGPALNRVAAHDHVVAEGTSRAVCIPEGSKVLVAFSSAMMDDRRLFQPRKFQPNRQPHEYMHFGYGLHTCFGIHINKALLPLIVKPLLRRKALRRAEGQDGHLKKRGAFSDSLWVQYSP